MSEEKAAPEVSQVTSISPAEDEAQGKPLGERLIQDPKLGKLFEQYPTLRAKLRSIFEATVAEQREEPPQARNWGQQSSQRSPDQRIAHAMRVIATNLKAQSADASGLTAFAQLVADLGHEGTGSELRLSTTAS